MSESGMRYCVRFSNVDGSSSEHTLEPSASLDDVLSLLMTFDHEGAYPTVFLVFEFDCTDVIMQMQRTLAGKVGASFPEED